MSKRGRRDEQQAARKRKHADTDARDTLLAEIRKLEDQVKEDLKHANGIATLLDHFQDERRRVAHAAMHSLHRIFQTVIADDLDGCQKMKKKQEEKKNNKKKKSKDTAGMGDDDDDDTAASAVADWLRARRQDFLRAVVAAVHREGIRVPALLVLMELVRGESRRLGRFATALFQRVIETLLKLNGGGEADNNETEGASTAAVKKTLVGGEEDNPLDRFVEDFLKQFDDVRMYTLRAIATHVQSDKRVSTALLRNAFSILYRLNMCSAQEDLTSFFVEEDQTPALRSLIEHRRAFSDCWIGFLRHALPIELHKRVLVILHADVMPHLINAKLLVDYLSDSYAQGGVCSLLALNGIFILMQHHHLEYPRFYARLYALFQPSLFHVKYRARFFRLANTFLSSTHLPAYLVASFVKRLVRLTLHAPPHAPALVIPFAHNMLRRHPMCRVLIHRGSQSTVLKNIEIESETKKDPFNFEETDPQKTNAIDSSLWELQILDDHFMPEVARLAQMFRAKFTGKQELDLDPFVSVSYDSLFDDEMRRKVRKEKAPALSHETPAAVHLTRLSSVWS